MTKKAESFETYSDAKIIEDPAYESALAKIRGGRSRQLTHIEKRAVWRHAITPSGNGNEDKETKSLASRRRRLKRAGLAQTTVHNGNIRAVAPTLNVVKLLFV
ncbi:hypothetical protein V7S43_016507 [Phytophthora oleae]|uniref:Uncharacterized protein n=1 Tax=Phytophthora oleae TaxID=2107226 RepID=A0ABD3EVZ4_9STRA